MTERELARNAARRLARPTAGVLAWLFAALGAFACGDADERSVRTPSSSDDVIAELMVRGIKLVGGTETRFSGALVCRADGSAQAKGAFAADASALCRRLRDEPGVFEGIGRRDRVCTQEFGGPQRAAIRGLVGSKTVDVSVQRNDGCGIADWSALKWLLGPPDSQ